MRCPAERLSPLAAFPDIVQLYYLNLVARRLQILAIALALQSAELTADYQLDTDTWGLTFKALRSTAASRCGATRHSWRDSCQPM